MRGVFPLVPSFDHAGPITRTVRDSALVFVCLAENQGSRSGTRRSDAARFTRLAAAPARKLRIGRPADFFWSKLDPEVRQLADAALGSLAELGALVQEVSLPSMSAASGAAAIVASVEAREVHEDAGYFPARAAEYSADVRERLELGGRPTGVEYVAARRLLHQARTELDVLLHRLDAIVTPATPIAATPIGAERAQVGDAEESVRSALLRLNRPANFTGLPAITVPCGFTSAGLPVGLQLIGAAHSESSILRIAHLYEQAHEWGSRHPALR
jgi:aspartyl-tRNA(Asn)/glutamyl-tRNA(Gln) amidotransferase subunit A